MPEERALFEVLSPLSEKELRSLISFALEIGGFACLVVRANQELAAAGELLLRDLSSYIVRDALKNSWPGTMLLDEEARVLAIRLTTHSGELLRSTYGALPQALGPDLPEDLGFCDSTGRAWFASISHEGLAFVELTPWELARLKHIAPGLTLSDKITGQSLGVLEV